MLFLLLGIFVELKIKYVIRKVKVNNIILEKFIVKYCDDCMDNFKWGKLYVDKGRVFLYILEDVRNFCCDVKMFSIKMLKLFIKCNIFYI